MSQPLQKFLRSPGYLLTEFLILCIAVPGYIIVTKSAPFLFVFLWGAVLYGYFILKTSHHETIMHIWKWKAVNWGNLKPILIRWVLASIGMLGFIYFYDPSHMLFITRERPEILPYLLTLYPLLSALPQEFIFCSFFFCRYIRFFGRGKWMVAASTLVFAYAHVLYINPIAPTLSLLGGYIFATTYLKTKSLALVTIEHGLYGNALFVTGLGWYFYSGAVQ